MRRIHSKRLVSGRQDWHAEMKRATAAFCLVLLLAPMFADAARVRGRKLPPEQPASKRTRRKAAWCSKRIAGCSLCYEEAGKIAAGAQFPGASAAHKQEPIKIVRCLRCQPSYIYNKDNENCDCAPGYGTAFPNGTLIAVDSFTPSTFPTQISDSMPFPEYTSTNGSSQPSAAATTHNFAEANPALKERAVVREMALNRRLQPAQRRRFTLYMQSMGYSVRTSPQGTFLSDGPAPRVTSFSSVDSAPVGVLHVPESPLLCSACKDTAVSVGGLIGGSFCMPCEAGMTPNHKLGTCSSLS